MSELIIPSLTDLKIAHDWVIKKVERAATNISGNPENYNRMVALHSEITDFIDNRVAKIISDERSLIESKKENTITDDKNAKPESNVDTQSE